MKTRLGANVELDVLNQHELRAHLDAQTTSWFQERARGETTERFDATGTVVTGAVTIPAVGDKQKLGPQKGFLWKVERITADGLGSGDVLFVYRNSVQPRNKIGYITAASSFPIGGKPPILRGDEKLVITGASLTATGDITINGEAAEVAEADFWKLGS